MASGLHLRFEGQIQPSFARAEDLLQGDKPRSAEGVGIPQPILGENVKQFVRIVACLISPLMLVMACLAQQSGLQSNAASGAKPVKYGNLPLLFVRNQGQADPGVQFFSTGAGYNVFLTSGDMVLLLKPSEVANPDALKIPAAPVAPAPQARSLATAPPSRTTLLPLTAAAAMAFKLVGASTNPTVVGENPQVTKANYFIGNDRSKWLTNIPTYGQVRYKNVYPGIDLVYYGTQHQVEYDFDVSPGADPTKIQFAVQGADTLSIDSDGNLMLTKGTGELHFQAPMVYQLSAGQRVKVPGSYAVSGSNRIGFTVNNYDSSKPLVIDPVLIYSTFLGGSSYDSARGIAVDSNGNAYVVGQTSSPNFPLATLGNLTPGSTYIFLSKLDVSGTTLLWTDYVCGTSGSDWPAGIAVDTQGNAYITGVTYSSDFPMVNAFQGSLNGSDDAFVSKVSTDGSQLMYSTYLGGSNWNQASGVTVDSTGLATVVGTTASLDFPMANAFQSTASPNQNSYYGDYGFVTKFSADGSTLVFSTYLGGSQVDVTDCWGCGPYSQISGIAVDANGNVYVTGETDTTDFPVSDGAYLSENPTTNSDGYETSFITSFTPSGGLNYSTYFGGTTYSYIAALTVDSSDAVYVTGSAPADGSFPVTNTSICNLSNANCSSAFVAKLNASGTEVIYSTFLGPNNSTQGMSIQVDPSGDAYVLANFGNQNYVLTNPIEVYNNTGGPLIDEIDPTGSTELFSTFLGGSNGTSPTSMVVDANSSIFVTGVTGSNDFPVVQSAFQGTYAGNNDVFISKITPDNDPAFTVYPSLLQFSTRTVGTTSVMQTTTIRNMGTAALNINSKTLVGDFAETDNCNSSVAAAATCALTITFTPTTPGSRFGTITFGDNAAGSPHFINLVGDGSAPLASITPTSLTFASAAVSITSAAQTVTLSNTGNATLNIGDIQISGDFAQTNNCPPALSFGSSCQFQITFTPAAGGVLTGALTLTDDAPDSPQTISLSGSGFVTTATVSPATLSFGNQNLSATSTPQVVSVTNTGGNVMDVSSVTTTGDFSQTNNCGTLTASGGACSINVTFTPTASGARTGTLVINDNAQGNPHSVTLSGVGIAGAASLSASNLTFASSSVGSTSSAQTLTITNTGNGTLSVTSVQVNGDFSQTNSCSTVAASSSCAVQVTFTPTASGSRTGTLTITSSAIGGPQMVALSGSGVDFSMPASGGTSTIQAGGTATYQFSVASVGGTFSNPVTLSCQGVPAFANCTVNPTSVTPGANGASVTVTVTTNVASSSPQSKHRAGTPGFWIIGGFGVFGIVLLGTGCGKSKRLLAGMGLALFMTLALIGCGSGSTTTTQPSKSVTPNGNYTLIVVGTSGSAQQFSSLTLVVQ
jgi:hypothetical protein